MKTSGCSRAHNSHQPCPKENREHPGRQAMKTVARFRFRISRGINTAVSATRNVAAETETDDRLQNQIKA